MNNSLCTKRLFTRTIFTILLAMTVTQVTANMGRIYASDARVSEEGQKAIILHNYNEEVLILGTDLKADKSTGIIRFIPFPSEPTVKLAPDKSFESIAALLKSHEIKFVTQSKSGSSLQSDVELRFNQKMGSHDITIVKINNTNGFREWVNSYFKRKGLPIKDEYPDIESVVNDYLSRGINWFVLDYVDVSTETKLIEPVEYRFKTDKLYYPLKDTNTFGGSGTIDLFVIAPVTLLNPLSTYYNGSFGLRDMLATTSSEIRYNELNDVLPDAESFFDTKKIYIQMMSYKGEYKFDKDIYIDFSKGTPAALWHEDSGPNFLDELNGYTTSGSLNLLTAFTPKAKYFSLKIPGDWDKTETDLTGKGGDYQLMLSAPGVEYREYATITVDWIADETKTPERYLYDLQNPQYKPPYEDLGQIMPVTVDGKQAWRLEMKSKRSPLIGTQDESIDVALKYVVIPASVGYYVIRYDVPMKTTRLYIDIFDAVVNSFVPQTTFQASTKSVKEISEEEYKVFTDFFKISENSVTVFPEYFDNVFHINSVSAITLKAKKPNYKMMKKFLGDGYKPLYKDYLMKNALEYLIKDKILIPYLSVVSEKKKKMINNENYLSETPSRMSEMIYLSRVGFNSTKTRALFYISVYTAPGTSYFVVMLKIGDKWVYENSIMTEMLIF